MADNETLFAGILGNETVLRVLERSLEAGEIPHAYLFHGPSGVGKWTVARRFGAALVSEGDRMAGGRALRGLHPDLVEVRAEGAFTTIGQVREVVRLAASRPFEGARRVFILEADTFNVQAANALLKTLEEPEGEAVFILLATSREEVLPTIISRSRVLRFNPVPTGEIAAFLREKGTGNPELAAALGRGSVGLALRYAEEGEIQELRGAVFGAAFAYTGDFEERHGAVSRIMSRAEALGAAKEAEYLERFEEPGRREKDAARRAGRAARDGAVREALDLLALVYRDAEAVRAGAEELAVNTDRIEEIRRRVGESPEADWAGAAIEIGEARASLTYNVSPESIMEVTLSRARRKIMGISPVS